MKLANQWNLFSPLALTVALGAALLATPAHAAPVGGYRINNLVSDTGDAPRQNSNLVNPIGLTAIGGMFVAENGSGSLGSAVNAQLQILVPSVIDSSTISKPTGLVRNPSAGAARTFFFTNVVFMTNSLNPTNIITTQRTFRGAATLITVTEEGTIAAWNPAVSKQAVIVVNNFASGAIYKGATIAKNSNGDWWLFVANFHSSQIEIYDGNFQLVKTIDNPSFIPAGFAPFNVKNIAGRVFAAYARQGSNSAVDEPAPGNGYIAVLNRDGLVIRDLTHQGALNSPWGLALAPRHFGKFSHALLVGNNGDGHITAFDILSGENLGQLADRDGNLITIDGLWALEFNVEPVNGNFDFEAGNLFFSAGTGAKAHGLIGAIRANAPFSNQ